MLKRMILTKNIASSGDWEEINSLIISLSKITNNLISEFGLVMIDKPQNILLNPFLEGISEIYCL